MFAQVSENFSDGDFTSNPTWSGNDSAFSVVDGVLQLVAENEAATKYLATPSQAIDQATWVCNVRFQFNPSSSNFARVYLCADQSNLALPLNGYFIAVGSSTDDICLYRQTGTVLTKIIDGPDHILNATSVNINVKVTRDDDGNWTLFNDLLLNNDYMEVGQVFDANHVQSQFAGVYCRFTATRSQDIFFDDIDIKGNPHIPPASIEYKDIIITEIFADPSPVVALPEAEFVEIYNRSNNILMLTNLSFSDETASAQTPSEKIHPGEYIILCDINSANALKSFGRTIGLNGFPSLNNSAEKLTLSIEGRLIDFVDYSSKTYRNKVKAEGGWSLELIDVNNPCGEEANWAASEDERGGTPGAINAIAADRPDRTPPNVIGIIPGASSILITFDERLSESAPSLLQASIAPMNEFHPVAFVDDRHRAIVMESKTTLEFDTPYTLNLKNIVDCNGNILLEHVASFKLPEIADSMDVVINEILFNPRPTGVDFIEIYNRSEKYVNIKDWAVSKRKDQGTEERSMISNEDLIMRPHEYLLLTTDGDVVKGEYINAIEENFQVVNALPSMNDDDGNIALVNGNDNVIDGLAYNTTMHAPFIKNEEGVSLERINPHMRTQDNNNWKSAGSQVGFATPGYVNSMRFPEYNAGEISISPEVFIPITGNPDFTQVIYKFDTPGFVANIKVFDAHGRSVRTLANNAILGSDGFIRWDGDRDDGNKAQVGSYMVHLEVFDSNGNVSTYRKRVAIGF